jgi:TonB-linked SusC/RagA family outer membrane protein
MRPSSTSLLYKIVSCVTELKRMRSLLLVAFFCSFFSSAFTQTVTVTGRVTAGDTALAGVTVNVKSTTISTQTDVNGRFTIQAPPNGVLVFSHVSYNLQEVRINNRASLTINMLSGNRRMDEVIVVGYATQRRASVTGAISQVNSEDLIRTPATTISAALVGKVQGITSRSPDSRPGRGTNIQIRNLGNPLYVIDGVPYTGGSTNITGFGFTQGAGQDIFNTLGLEDIESVTILKDASAAIYGLRAANGVVLITTKKGRRETPSINVSGYYGFQNFTRYPKPANAGEFVTALVESEQNFGRDPSLLYSSAQLAKWKAGVDSGYRSFDYYDMVSRPNVPQSYISANASGGSQRSTYYFSLSNLRQDALIRDFKYNRTNVQANLNTMLANRLQLGTEIGLRLEKTHNVGVPGLDDYFNPFLSVTSMWPTERPYANDNPKYINQTHNVNVNPATYKNDVTGWADEMWHAMDLKLHAQYDFKFGLTAKALVNYNYQNEDFDGMEYTWKAYIYDPLTGKYNDRPTTGGALYGNQNPWRERHKRNVISRYAQFQLSYNKTIGSHNFSAVAGYERSDYDNAYYAVHTIPTNNYVSLQSFAEQDFLQDSWGVEARAGYIGRLNYNYKQTYLVELLGRYDGSYLYAPDARWGFFSGVSVGWRLTNEKFMENLKGTWLNDLKFRASYGEVGSESGVSAWDYLAGYNFLSGSAVLDNSYVIGLRPRGNPITSLSWVMNRTKNIGLDFTVLDNKISGQFDVFERKRTGLPAGRYDVTIPVEAGAGLANENLNADAHRGIEGIVTYSNKAGKFNYSVGVNGTLSRLRSLYTYKPRFGNSWDEYRNSAEDRWSGITFGYHVVGRFASWDDINNYTINNDGQGNRTELPGDFKYEDANGDGVINGLDQRPIGYAQGAQPYMSFGLNSHFSYKGITLSVDFAGATMQSFRRTVELLFPFQNNGNSAEYMLADRWHRADPYNPYSEWIPGKYPAIRKDLNGHINYQLNDYWLINVSYIRLRNLEIGYEIPKNLLKRVGISRLRVYANGTNLFSIDNVKDLEMDPEISLGSALVYPQQRLYTFGFNLSF